MLAVAVLALWVFVFDDVVTVVVLEVVDMIIVSVQSDVIMVVVKFGGERVEYVKCELNFKLLENLPQQEVLKSSASIIDLLQCTL